MSLVYVATCARCRFELETPVCPGCKSNALLQYLVQTCFKGTWDWQHFADHEREASFDTQEEALALRYDLQHQEGWASSNIRTLVVSERRSLECFQVVFPPTDPTGETTFFKKDIATLLNAFAEQGGYSPEVQVFKCSRMDRSLRPLFKTLLAKYTIQNGRVYPLEECF